jgi:hypothetical protein
MTTQMSMQLQGPPLETGCSSSSKHLLLTVAAMQQQRMLLLLLLALQGKQNCHPSPPV